MMLRGSTVRCSAKLSSEQAVPVVVKPVSVCSTSQIRNVIGSRQSVPSGAQAVRTRPSRVVCRAASDTVASALDSGVVKTAKPMDIVFVAAEVAPWSKTGGLGDVVGGLPIELVKRGHRVITIAPRYDQYADGWDTSVVVNVDGEDVRYFHSLKKGVHRVFIDHPWFLAKVWGKTGAKLYGPKSGADYIDNHRRFALFNKAAIEAVRALPFGPGENCVFVANDWHTALLPVLIKEVYQPKGQFLGAKVAFCIHNIAFQGRMWDEVWKDMSLPQSAYPLFQFEDGYNKVYTELTPLDEEEKPSDAKLGVTYKKLNWMKAGILASDKVLTVSPNYASEISADPSGGVELDKYIRAAGGVEGIVNGMDVEEWNPKKDKFLSVKYDKTTVVEGKAAAKQALQAELGLAVDPSIPLFCFIGRLEEQKGADILLEAVPEIVKSGKAQVAILGTGKAKLEKAVAALGKGASTFAKGVVKFSPTLAHLMTAGADFILVPSRFEPCGLIQLHAMQYGTIPLVSSTGGLIDTVKEGVTGFHFGAFDPDELEPADVKAIVSTAEKAVQVYGTPVFTEMVKACIGQDLSWKKPAQKWEGVLEELVSGTGKGKSESVVTPVEEKPVKEKAPAVAA